MGDLNTKSGPSVPTDEMIDAALKAWHGTSNVKWMPHERERMRRVLQAVGIYDDVLVLLDVIVRHKRRIAELEAKLEMSKQRERPYFGPGFDDGNL